MGQVEQIGDQMVELTREDAESLRQYLIDKYKILPGCVEGLVWAKYGRLDGFWVNNDSMSEFYIEFCQRFVVRGAPSASMG
jgi:hypothetical protein